MSTASILQAAILFLVQHGSFFFVSESMRISHWLTVIVKQEIDQSYRSWSIERQKRVNKDPTVLVEEGGA